MNAEMIITARGKYRLTRRKPFTLSASNSIRITNDSHAEPGDKFYVYESDDGNLLLVKDVADGE